MPREKGNLVSIPRFCPFHQAEPSSLFPHESCEAGHCSVVTRGLELREALVAVGAIADDLVESLERDAGTILGSELGSALTIRALVGWVSSNLGSQIPDRAADEAEEPA